MALAGHGIEHPLCWCGPPRCDALGFTHEEVAFLDLMSLPPSIWRIFILMQELPGFSNSRDLDCAEFYCGLGAVTRAMQARGARAVGYDIGKDPRLQDFCSPLGYSTALQWSRRLRRGTSLVWLGTVCSTWVFLNRGTSRRTRALPTGSMFVPSVELGNIMVVRSALLIIIAYAIGASWVLEQPANSCMSSHPIFVWIRHRLRTSSAGRWLSIRSSMGAFGGDTVKQHEFFCNEAWIKSISRPRPKHFKAKHGLCNHYVASDGKKRVSGGDHLKGSQAYTDEFGHAVAAGFLDHRLKHNLEEDLEQDADLDFEPDAASWDGGDFGEVLEHLISLKLR